MDYRKLRIVWSVGWGLATILLLGMWVRSYWRSDVLQFGLPGSRGAVVTSRGGLVRLALAENLPRQFAYLSTNIVDLSVTPQATHYGFAYATSMPGKRNDVIAPIWCPSLVVAIFAGAPWLRSRFTLRTLLIATTLVAVGLGLIAWGEHLSRAR